MVTLWKEREESIFQDKFTQRELPIHIVRTSVDGKIEFNLT